MQPRNITVGLILGATLLGAYFAPGEENRPPWPPRPVMPPEPTKETALPAKNVPVVPELPSIPKQEVKPTVVESKKIEPVQLPDVPPLPSFLPLPDPKPAVQPVQFVEPKGLPLPPIPAVKDDPIKVPDLPRPPQPLNPAAAIPPAPLPPIFPELPTPPVVKPEPKKIAEPAPATVTPWTPKDTTTKPTPPAVESVLPPVVKVPPTVPTETVPPRQVPAVPVNTTPEGTSRFVVPPKTQTVTPAPVAQASPPEVRPEPMLTPPAPQVPPGPPRFTMVKIWRAPEKTRTPGPLPTFNETAVVRPTVQEPLNRDFPLGGQTPLLTVEKRGPLFSKAGSPLKYQIVVRNVGNVPAQQVRVEDDIPGVQLVSSNPTPTQQQTDRVIWIVSTLKPGEEKTFIQELQPLRPGDVVSTTSVHVYASTSFRTTLDGAINSGVSTPIGPLLDNPPKIESLAPPKLPIIPPSTAFVAPGHREIPLSVEVKAPASGLVGQKIVFEVVITNRGDSLLSGLMLYGKLPPGLGHPEGDNIGADLPDLAPGEMKSFKMPLTATQTGRFTLEIRVTSGKDFDVVARPSVMIEAPGLTIQQSAHPRWLMGQEHELKIEITNNHPAALRQVQILDVLPEGLEFVSASDRGMYQTSTRTVAWQLDQLPPGKTRVVSLRVQSKSPGQFPHEVIAKADDLPEAKSSMVYQVEGFTNLQVQVQARENPLEQGKETVHAVRVTNQGSTMATNVQVAVTLSAGLEAGAFAQAPTAYRVNGKEVVFAPLARLQPGGTVTYHIGVRAVSQGDQRVRAQVVSEQNRTPISREESLIVYRDKE